MKRRKARYLIYFATLVLLMTALLARNSLRRSAHIVLPEEVSAVAEDSGGSLPSDAVIKVELTADNVQNAIATLRRPVSYRRTVTMETRWSGGGSVTYAQVAVLGAYTRVDAQLTSGQVRHSITDGVHTWVWYDSSVAWTVFAVGDISADDEQRIPTYEDILHLPPEVITAATYTTLSGVPSIFVETAPDEAGYVQRYWVSAETGLLVGAQRLADEALVYRVEALTVETAAPTAEDFLLPDGTVLPEFSEEQRKGIHE